MPAHELQPRVKKILDEVLEEHDLDPSVATKLLIKGAELDGPELDEALARTLRRA